MNVGLIRYAVCSVSNFVFLVMMLFDTYNKHFHGFLLHPVNVYSLVGVAKSGGVQKMKFSIIALSYDSFY